MAFEGSSVSGYLPRRRSLLLGGLGGASTAALTALGHTGTAAADQAGGSAAAEPPDFDFDTGNFHRYLVNTPADRAENSIGPMDASVLVYLTYVSHTAFFDALAPYHPTAVGVHSRIGRRPAGESATNRNKNTAGLYAGYQVCKALFPDQLPAYRQLMTALGLDPDDESEDPTSPVGIGTIAAKAALEAATRSGMNLLGDEGREYNGQPFEDYTGYEPVNTAYTLVDPSRWQPAMGPHRRRVGGGPGDKGIFVVQQFVTPQLRLVKANTYRHPGRFELAPPDHLDHTNPRRYKRSVDEILEASAALTDEQKVKTEIFDNKFLGIAEATKAAAITHELDLDNWIHLHFTSSVAQIDALIAAWHYKNHYDAVRPFSAVKHVYGKQKVTAWGGPGKGTVDDLPADEWASYLPVGNHPDYPSGSATLCSAEAQAARRFLDSDSLEWTYPIPAGWSLTEPGLVPAEDMELHYATWTDFVQDCAMSRVWGGVHFTKTMERSIPFGTQFGDRAHEFVQRHIKGDVED